MPGHASVVERLAKLQLDQRRAATAPPGPVLCVAPAGSGKTTTLVARIAWLIDEGVAPESICAISFNRRAAEELRERVATALEPLGADLAGRVRIRTFHALGLELLRAAGRAVEPLVDRDDILRAIRPSIPVAERRRLDTVLSRAKLDLDLDPAEIRADPDAGPVARTFADYEAEIARRGGLDFDDLVARALRLLEADSGVRAEWRSRCAHLLVDEAQDLDRAQLRLALLLAAPANRIFLVGDDDQSIYGWRLADVRRLLGLADDALPGLLRVDLETNYRCPAAVLARAVRLIEHNEERFAKVIRAGPSAQGRLILAPTAADDTDRALAVLHSWPADGSSRAILARTNRELLPAVAAALRLEVPFRLADVELPVDSPIVDSVIDRARELAPRPASRAVAEAIGWDRVPTLDAESASGPSHAADDDEAALARRRVEVAVLAWSAAFASVDAFAVAIAETRAALARLRREDADLSLATAHGTKGLEFDHVAVIGMDDGRFPSARSVAEALEPPRALEEERRLAYVAWTRARRSLTLVYDPGSPSFFLREAFSAAELGLSDGPRTGRSP